MGASVSVVDVTIDSSASSAPGEVNDAVRAAAENRRESDANEPIAAPSGKHEIRNPKRVLPSPPERRKRAARPAGINPHVSGPTRCRSQPAGGNGPFYQTTPRKRPPNWRNSSKRQRLTPTRRGRWQEAQKALRAVANPGREGFGRALTTVRGGRLDRRARWPPLGGLPQGPSGVRRWGRTVHKSNPRTGPWYRLK